MTGSYAVAVKTDAAKTVQIKYTMICVVFSHILSSIVLTESKLAHGSVNFPVRLISHFAMNTVMAETCSIARVIPPNVIISWNSPKFLPKPVLAN